MFGGFSGLSSAQEIEARKAAREAEEKEKSVEDQLQGITLEEVDPDLAFSREDLVLFINTSKEDLLSEETKADLIQKRKDPSQTDPARILLRKQQEKVWEAFGREKVAGMRALYRLPKRFEDDEELIQLHASYALCAQKAFVDLVRDSKPETLQSSGSLTKDQIMDFFEVVNSLMALEETKAALEKFHKDTQTPPNTLVVEMQRDMLENLGIEKEFGVAKLNTINQDFPNDLDLMKAMQEFAMAAQFAVREAVVGREAMNEQRKVMKTMEKMQEDIVREIQAMSDSEVEEFMKRVQPTMMSHMQVMQVMQPPDRLRYMNGLEKEERRDMMKFQMILAAHTGGHSHDHHHGPGGCSGNHDHSHGHSHGGEPCQGHGHASHGHSHGHSHDSNTAHEHSHGHSHGGEPCQGHGHASQEPPTTSESEHTNEPEHGHSHAHGETCDHPHEH